MAKYTYETIMSELKGGTFRPVYYLMGEEGYFTDRITDYIMENALDEVERDFNMTVYYGLKMGVKLMEQDLFNVLHILFGHGCWLAKKIGMIVKRIVLELIKASFGHLMKLRNRESYTILLFLLEKKI